MTCVSCTSLLQLGLSLSIKAQRLDREGRERAARPSGCATPDIHRALQLEDYDVRLAAWQAAVRDHLTHSHEIEETAP